MSNLGVREVGCDMGELFVRLNRLAASAVNHSEIVAAFFVLAVIFMMVLPLPTWLVDSLIALNICIATLLVVFAMYLPGPWHFRHFRRASAHDAVSISALDYHNPIDSASGGCGSYRSGIW